MVRKFLLLNEEITSICKSHYKKDKKQICTQQMQGTLEVFL